MLLSSSKPVRPLIRLPAEVLLQGKAAGSSSSSSSGSGKTFGSSPAMQQNPHLKLKLLLGSSWQHSCSI
jgi:hypothetical protein